MGGGRLNWNTYSFSSTRASYRSDIFKWWNYDWVIVCSKRSLFEKNNWIHVENEAGFHFKTTYSNRTVVICTNTSETIPNFFSVFTSSLINIRRNASTSYIKREEMVNIVGGGGFFMFRRGFLGIYRGEFTSHWPNTLEWNMYMGFKSWD